MTDKLQAIREACIKANPTVEQRFCCKYSTIKKEDFCDYCLSNPRTLHLTDVLLAIDQSGKLRDMTGKDFFIVTAKGRMGFDDMDMRCYYNLRQDDLSLQSTETINFLYELLTKQ